MDQTCLGLDFTKESTVRCFLHRDKTKFTKKYRADNVAQYRVTNRCEQKVETTEPREYEDKIL